jgi:mono/diheme cytochrome c family protein
MYARTRDDGGVAVYVDNYLFQNEPGDASLYSPLGLDAAIAKDQRFLIGSNVIEYSPIDPNEADSEKITKLIAYGPKDANGVQPRILKVNFDGRGEKFMPGVCGVCHGASLYPLEPDSTFPVQALRSFKMNILDPKPFGFSTQEGFTEAQQESPMRGINQLVHGTFTGFKEESSDNSGKWSADFALDLDAGAYGGDFSGTSYDHDYIPEGWRENENRPVGIESLYLNVIKVHCVACHALRGSELAESLTTAVGDSRVSVANAINLSSYEKFISYNDQIIDLVYRRGQMPLSFLNYRQFWSNPEGVPTQLASFLQGFDVYDLNGKIVAPQKPVAIAGGNRVSSSPVLMNGSASFFAASHEWRVTDMPEGAVVSISGANAPVASISADTAGDYVVELSVTNGLSLETKDSAVITLDPLLNPLSIGITFDEHIVPILSRCAACHVDGGFFAGIPVDFSQGNSNLFTDVLARVNLGDPQSSLLLTKSTGSNHGGGRSLNRESPSGEENYQTILNWLINGAPCGTDVLLCR